MDTRLNEAQGDALPGLISVIKQQAKLVSLSANFINPVFVSLNVIATENVDSRKSGNDHNYPTTGFRPS